jgi:hypothetical protein
LHGLRDLLAIAIQYSVPPIVGAAEGDHLILPVPLLAYELANLVVDSEVMELVVTEAGCVSKA